MSTTEIKNVLGIDGRLDPNARKNKINIILQGGSQSSFLRTTASNVSSSNVGFSVTVPNARTYLPRVVYVQIQGNTTVTGASAGVGTPFLQCSGLPHTAGVPVGNGNYFAPRCDPLNQIISQCQINFNGWQLSGNINGYARYLQWFHRSIDAENIELSMSPMMHDNSLNYGDVAGSVRSPLANYQNNSVQDPRGCFPNVLVTSNTALGAGDSATIYWSFITPVVLSPFIYSKDYQEQLAFIQVTKLDFNFILNGRGTGPLGGLGGGLFSFDTSGGSTLTGSQTNISAAALFNQFLYPPSWQSIPREVNYAYSMPTYSPTNFGVLSFAAGATDTLTTGTFQRNTTPNAIFIAVTEFDGDADMTKTDAPQFTINNVLAQWDSGAPILSTLSKYDVYQQLHVAKGGRLSWRQWSGTRDLIPNPVGPPVYDAASSGGTMGSAICILPGIDIPLLPGDSPGCGNQKHSFFFTINCTNLSNRAIRPQISVLIIDDGIFQIKDLVAQANTSVFQPEDVKSVENMEPIRYKEPASVLGGSFWGDLLQGIKKIARPVTNAAKALLPGNEIVRAVDAGLSSIGLGMKKRRGKAKGSGLGLGVMKGGAQLTQRQLQNLAVSFAPQQEEYSDSEADYVD